MTMTDSAAPLLDSGRPAVVFREFDLLLAAARTAPDVPRIEGLAEAGIDWRALLDLATTHGVRLLVYKSLREACWRRIPAGLQTAWTEAHQLLTGKNLFLTGELLRVTAEFQKSGISVAAMKGAVIAEMVYGDFTLREFSDIDLLVREADFTAAVELIARLGYEPFWKHDSGKILRFLRHLGEYKLTSDALGTEIDLHWRLAHKTVALSPKISDFPAGFQPLAIAGSTVLTFAPQDVPLYLASQGGGDQWGDLRRICDLAEFLRRYTEIDWEPHLRTARRLGGLRSMLTGLALAHELLDAPLPESIAARIRADATVSQLAERTIQNLRSSRNAGDAISRYGFQIAAKAGWGRKIALACSIVTDRSMEDGSWLMLPRPLWWLYPVLRPLRMGSKLLRRA